MFTLRGGVISYPQLLFPPPRLFLFFLLSSSLPPCLSQPNGPEELRDSDKCQNPLPLFLLQPHTQTFHLTLDPSHEALFKTGLMKTGQLIRQFEPSPSNNERTDYKLVPPTLIADGYKVGFNKLSTMEDVNNALEQHSVTLDTEGNAYKLFRFKVRHGEFASYSGETESGYLSELATVEIQSNEVYKVQHVADLALLGPQESCKKMMTKEEVPPDCNVSPAKEKYRTADGTCNNLPNPTWGASFTAFVRVTPTDYGDDVKTMRLNSKRKPLPSARLISTTVNMKPPTSSSSFTLLHMTFGQFLDHDLTATPVATGNHEEPFPCCDEMVLNNPKLQHPECAPIQIPRDDPFYSAYGITCMEFVRSLPAGKCILGPREQLNQVTSYVDGSAVYGSTPKMTRELRANTDGLLAMQVTQEGQELLPASTDRNDGCNVPSMVNINQFCFSAGDARANEQVLLTLLTTVFARLHNNYARELKKINREWNDERLYQEAKRVVVAVLQQITYNEFLPLVLGPAFVRALGLAPQEDGRFTNDYDASVSAAVSNEFATAAFRFGHSMIPTQLLEVDTNGTTTASNLNGVIFSPFAMYEGRSLANMARGAINQMVGNIDMLFTDEITGKLFRREIKAGMDLVALNIQRGRDHGLSAYVVARDACGLGRARTFRDLADAMDSEVLTNLQKVYKSVEDIDLFIGALAEKAIAGAQVGPTLACIIGDQFLRLKKGDRYWFEYKDSPGAFTKDQLREIHKMSMGRVLCDTVLGMDEVQRWPLTATSFYNPRLPCSSPCFSSINFTFWKE